MHIKQIIIVDHSNNTAKLISEHYVGLSELVLTCIQIILYSIFAVIVDKISSDKGQLSNRYCSRQLGNGRYHLQTRTYVRVHTHPTPARR